MFYDVTGKTVEVLAIVPKSEAETWLAQFLQIWNEGSSLSEVKDDLSRFLKEAEKEQIVITRHGKPAGVLIGFESEDEWFDFGSRTTRVSLSASRTRASLRAGRGTKLEDLKVR